MRSIESRLKEIEAEGIRPVAISADTPEESRELCRKAGYTFPFLSDRNAEVAGRYDLVHKGAGADGRDIARPAEFLLDRSGTVRWVNLTESYWVRARVDEIMEQVRRLE